MLHFILILLIEPYSSKDDFWVILQGKLTFPLFKKSNVKSFLFMFPFPFLSKIDCKSISRLVKKYCSGSLFSEPNPAFFSVHVESPGNGTSSIFVVISNLLKPCKPYTVNLSVCSVKPLKVHFSVAKPES